MPAYLSQHFLKDEDIARRIVEAVEVVPGDVVVEIGPGEGMLTRLLFPGTDRLFAVELDRGLVEGLAGEFKAPGRFTLVHADFLKWDLDRELTGFPVVKFVGNLPYSVASPILQKTLAWPKTSTAVFMFQHEVAERLVAEPGTKAYGVLTLATALHAEVEWIASVGHEKFRPRPKVDSAVLRFRRRAAPLLPPNMKEGEFLRVVKAAFSQRRKQVLNALAHALGREKAVVQGALEDCGIPPQARAEEIPFEGFARLTRRLEGGADVPETPGGAG